MVAPEATNQKVTLNSETIKMLNAQNPDNTSKSYDEIIQGLCKESGSKKTAATKKQEPDKKESDLPEPKKESKSNNKNKK